VDIRILAATNEDIEACVAERRFREDLYYRLAAFRLHLPPLRERPKDIVPLFLYCAGRIRPEIAAHLAKGSMRKALHAVLAKASFRGNVRELDNVARRFCLLWKPDQSTAAERALLTQCLGVREETADPPADLKTALRHTEKTVLQELVGVYRSRQELAHALGVDRSTLWRKLRRHGVVLDRDRPGGTPEK